MGKVRPAFNKNNIAVAITSSNEYVPYLSVLLQSIKDNSSAEYNYDIIILNRNIEEQNKDIIYKQLGQSNFSVRFVSVNEYLEGRKFHTGRLCVEAYFRMFLIDILDGYDKILYLDADIVTEIDIAKIFKVNISNYYIYAAIDVNIASLYISKNHWYPYINDILKLDNPLTYIQSGVLLMNLNMFRENYTFEQIMKICSSYEWRLFDQDILNMMCKNKIKFMPMSYNVINGMEHRMETIRKYAPNNLKRQYMYARNNPKIIHFVGNRKPWIDLSAEYSEFFWKYAQRTVFYKQIILNNICKDEITNLKEQIFTLKQQLKDK